MVRVFFEESYNIEEHPLFLQRYIQAFIAPFLLIPTQTCVLTGCLRQGFKYGLLPSSNNKIVGKFATALSSHHSI